MYEKILTEIQQDYYKKNYPNEGQAFVAWYLRNIYGLDESLTKQCITDGCDDKKIDAVYIDDAEQVIHVIQGKFYKDAVNGEPVQECLALFNHLKDLQSLQENGNAKIKAKVQEISSALDDEYSLSIELIIPSELTPSALNDFNVYQQKIAEDEQLPAILRLIDNENLKVLYDDNLNKKLPYISHNFNLDEGKYLQIDFNGMKCVIVALSLNECANIPHVRDGLLFRKNVRHSLGLNKVNKGIAATIKNNPNDFFFFHNGVTAICSSLKIENNILKVTDLNVVNGCQSLSTISNCSESIKKNNSGYILFRFYEVTDANRGDKISIYTNSQSAVKPRDLRSNDKAVLSIKKAYEQKYSDGYFVTKRGEETEVDKTKYNESHIINLTDLGKWLMAWHSQRPTNSYSESKVFDKYFTQLFKKDYSSENVQALFELFSAVAKRWEKENPLDLDETLWAMKANAMYHHLYAISYFFCAINKMPESVPIPSLSLQKLKNNDLLDEVVNMAGNCLNMAFINTSEDYIANNKIFSPTNWLRQKNCLKAIRDSIQLTINNLKIVPGGIEIFNRLKNGLKMESSDFTDRWTAD